MRDDLVSRVIDLAERGRDPDSLIRAGMRGVTAGRLRREARGTRHWSISGLHYQRTLES